MFDSWFGCVEHVLVTWCCVAHEVQSPRLQLQPLRHRYPFAKNIPNHVQEGRCGVYWPDYRFVSCWGITLLSDPFVSCWGITFLLNPFVSCWGITLRIVPFVLCWGITLRSDPIRTVRTHSDVNVSVDCAVLLDMHE